MRTSRAELLQKEPNQDVNSQIFLNWHEKDIFKSSSGFLHCMPFVIAAISFLWKNAVTELWEVLLLFLVLLGLYQFMLFASDLVGKSSNTWRAVILKELQVKWLNWVESKTVWKVEWYFYPKKKELRASEKEHVKRFIALYILKGT